jgi:uncharacterized protein YdiU (UPF0061 family)
VLVGWVPEVAELVGLPTEPTHAQAAALARLLGGNEVPTCMTPYAACYGGHQFGSWAGQLGDGRAITLTEVVRPALADRPMQARSPAPRQRWELQLKGAGPTPYSRMGDGRAVLRSSIREFLCSEAMHHLGVPSTRALSLVTTGEQVVRDMFYDGNPRSEPGAIVCRVAPSFLRFGNFEILASRGDEANLRALADYAIRRHFPALGEPCPRVYGQWFEDVCRKTAQMIVQWMRVGFVHGVMNTDNMSILGLTIDYGPYGWIDDYDPNWTPNTTDAATRRYRFGQQPQVAGWNLLRFATALHPLVAATEPFERGLRVYAAELERGMLDMFAAKLGLAKVELDEDAEDPRSGRWLVDELLGTLAMAHADMTIFFRRLVDVSAQAGLADEQRLQPLVGANYGELQGAARARTLRWLQRYAQRVRDENMSAYERRAKMQAANPKYVLRNYLAQQAIDRAEVGDFSLMNELLDVLRDPYAEQPTREAFAAKRPDWARTRPGCSMLSCSS